MNLRFQIDNLQDLFGRRNAMYLRGQRFLFLSECTRAFAKHVRKGSHKVHLASSLASVFSWTCAFADEFRDLPLIDAMREKFPVRRCAYCGDPVCTCATGNRKDIVHAVPDPVQLEWSASDWAANLDAVYGKANRTNGMQYAIGRLHEEICEAGGAQLLDIHQPGVKLDVVRVTISREIADVFSWTFAISAVLGIDLDSVLEEKYSGPHYRCGKRPCNCGPHYLHHHQLHPYVINNLPLASSTIE